MSTLTIQVDDELLARATSLAAARQMTVQEMVQRLLHVIAMPRLRTEDLPPLTRQAFGMLPPMTDNEVDAVLDEERTRKYEN
jgi:hypothetical protein